MFISTYLDTLHSFDDGRVERLVSVTLLKLQIKE